MKAYMGWDGSGDPSDGAALIFAHDSREARKVFWQRCSGEIAGDEFTGARILLLRGKPWLVQEMRRSCQVLDEAHVIDSPLSCDCCGGWGHEPIGEDGKCDSCRTSLCDALHHV